MADARQETHAYLIGGGIASLAAAAFLIRDARVSGMNIHILEETDRLGGSLDAQGSPEKGYILRGGRMFDEEAYTCTYDLLSSIPSIRNPSLSVKAGHGRLQQTGQVAFPRAVDRQRREQGRRDVSWIQPS